MITQKILKDFLSYDQKTGVFTWSKKRAGVRFGAVAGTRHHNGYLMIRLQRKQYGAHRLAWLYMTGDWPNQIDHINHIKSDNRWDNLRSVSCSENHQNRPLDHRNNSGFVGVRWNDADKRWVSYITVSGVNTHLGSFISFEDAVKAREEANIKHGFHENHGKQLTEPTT